MSQSLAFIRVLRQRLDAAKHHSAFASTILLLALIPCTASAIEIVECGPWVQPAENCDLVAGDSTSGLVVHSNILSEGALLLGGSIEIAADGRISSVGCATPATDAPLLRCGQSLVSPGFINLHEHLNYSSGPVVEAPLRPLVSRAQWRDNAAAWPGGNVKRRRAASALALVELRHLLRGTTSIAGRDGVKGMVRNLDVGRRRVIKNVTFPFGKGSFGVCPSRNVLPAGKAVLTHAGEGIDNQSLSEIQCLLQHRRQTEEKAPLALVHALAANEELASEMAALGVAVVWSPCSNMKLYGATSPYAMLRSHGVPVALGSDWLASGSPSVLDEIRCIGGSLPNPGPIGDATLLEMMTATPASAIAADDLGRIATGAWADLLVTPIGHRTIGEALSALVSPHDYRQQAAFIGGKLVYSAVQADYLKELSPAGICYALPEISCSTGGWVCGTKTIKAALALPRASEVLCPLATTNPNGSD